MWEDFKKFALKGNVVDMATGVVIGSAFGKIVSSLVNDIIMPLLGLLTGGINLTSSKWVIREAVGDAQPELSLNYGQFMQSIIDFFIIALSIFLVIRLFQKFRKNQQEEVPPEKEPEPTNEEILLTEIRDLLKETNAQD